jgi:SAM-dependent methyltransferase
MVKEGLTAICSGPPNRAAAQSVEGADAVSTNRNADAGPPDEMALSTGCPNDDEIISQGDRFLHIFRVYGGLETHHRVLEIGCGAGRMARALTGYLGECGSYDGFDPSPGSIAWCRQNITPSFTNFRRDRCRPRPPS